MMIAECGFWICDSVNGSFRNLAISVQVAVNKNVKYGIMRKRTFDLDPCGKGI